MKTAELFEKKTVFSLEIFPPKKSSSIATIYDTLDGLEGTHPDFISVTFGAVGAGDNKHTFPIASTIKKYYQIEAVAHLTAISLTRDQVLQRLHEMESYGIENVLALRGDLPADGEQPSGHFPHADALIEFVRENSDLNIIAACYPEKHPECPNRVDDIRNLKRKVDAGANHLISQLFFNNSRFYEFIERCDLAGINVPIEAGIMPVVNKAQIERIVSLCGADFPPKFRRMMERFGDNPRAMRDAGIAYAVDQIIDLITQGVDGIHLYTMNNPFIARRINDAVSNLISVTPPRAAHRKVLAFA
ncbi:MAG: methylenetetrahydrofolate reductase [NAD(P)H] [Corynebacterium glucuronolyticum]|nr:methylenetetrahydrofolate reductase [NAD(P)H] [Corynebacterium glucuronolyticum]MDD7585462.1 methylenetetrahydrofolate reductase [NAD(P)H] [Mycobacteriaceae bacterium]MDY5835210.1 methylenetetrahydrofolate reductase [NAD(P)H] [Corynebacterium glucuronolyticum]